MKRPSLPNFQLFSQDIPIKSNPGGHWRVSKCHVQPGVVTWRCDVPGSYIWIMFPEHHNPIKDGGPQASGPSPLKVTLGERKGYYPYCVLSQDPAGVFHLVEGNSPPEMEIG